MPMTPSVIRSLAAATPPRPRARAGTIQGKADGAGRDRMLQEATPGYRTPRVFFAFISCASPTRGSSAFEVEYTAPE